MKAKFTAEQIIGLFEDTPQVPAQLRDFAIGEVGPDKKARFTFFDGTEIYYVVSSNALTLFCNNEYYGVARVSCDYSGPQLRTFLVRADAIVLNNGGGLRLYPVGRTPDAVDQDSWDYLPRLRDHFVKQYGDLLRSMPESFEQSYARLIMTMGDYDLVLTDGRIAFADTKF